MEASETPEPRLEMEISHRAEIGDVAVDGWINGMYQRAKLANSRAGCQTTVNAALSIYQGTVDRQINDLDTSVVRVVGGLPRVISTGSRAFNQRERSVDSLGNPQTVTRVIPGTGTPVTRVIDGQSITVIRPGTGTMETVNAYVGRYQLSDYAKRLLAIDGRSLRQAFDVAYGRGQGGRTVPLRSAPPYSQGIVSAPPNDRYRIEGDSFVAIDRDGRAIDTPIASDTHRTLTTALRAVLQNNLTEFDPDDDLSQGNISFAEALSQNSGCQENPVVWGVGVGFQASYEGLTITGSGYWGRGLGTLLMLDTNSLDSYGNPIKNYGYIAQATYDFGQGTGVGYEHGRDIRIPKQLR